ncbi:uncharacterized protein C8A04DRAFT_30283 [Dichotomopilus funicola]|uniref:Uncharacterized protein n=1 Tax=Dichotomopilus funicola TaxID=1934379 RepID=A0AAN6UZY0_9PEZI|nr:hypothetical protein C8A04DRAFT_30283 [Dichotomopilus funicola]
MCLDIYIRYTCGHQTYKHGGCPFSSVDRFIEWPRVPLSGEGDGYPFEPADGCHWRDASSYSVEELRCHDCISADLSIGDGKLCFWELPQGLQERLLKEMPSSDRILVATRTDSFARFSEIHGTKSMARDFWRHLEGYRLPRRSSGEEEDKSPQIQDWGLEEYIEGRDIGAAAGRGDAEGLVTLGDAGEEYSVEEEGEWGRAEDLTGQVLALYIALG